MRHPTHFSERRQHNSSSSVYLYFTQRIIEHYKLILQYQLCYQYRYHIHASLVVSSGATVNSLKPAHLLIYFLFSLPFAAGDAMIFLLADDVSDCLVPVSQTHREHWFENPFFLAGEREREMKEGDLQWEKERQVFQNQLTWEVWDEKSCRRRIVKWIFVRVPKK